MVNSSIIKKEVEKMEYLDLYTGLQRPAAFWNGETPENTGNLILVGGEKYLDLRLDRRANISPKNQGAK